MDFNQTSNLENLVAMVNKARGSEMGIVRTTQYGTYTFQDAVFDFGSRGYIMVDYQEDCGLYEVSKCHPIDEHYEDAFHPHEFQTTSIYAAKERITFLIETMTSERN